MDPWNVNENVYIVVLASIGCGFSNQRRVDELPAFVHIIHHMKYVPLP